MKKTYAALEGRGSSVNENYISLLILPQMIISTNLKSQATFGSNSLAENNTYFTSRQGHNKIIITKPPSIIIKIKIIINEENKVNLNIFYHK